MKQIAGGVCAATGFSASGVHCGIRKNKTKRDLALIYSSVPASAAAVYTTNLVKGAPLVVTKQHLANGKAQAVICNSGNANTCNADGIEIAEETCALLAKELGMSEKTVSERLGGKGSFNTEQLEKTATMLGMSLYQLMIKLLQPIDGINQIKP